MEKDLQKRITKLLEGQKHSAERCLNNIDVCYNGNRNFIPYWEGRLRQATLTLLAFQELHDISLEMYVAMIKSIFESFEDTFETIVEPLYGKDTSKYNCFEGKDTSNYNRFEGRVDEMGSTLSLLVRLMKQEKYYKKAKILQGGEKKWKRKKKKKQSLKRY